MKLTPAIEVANEAYISTPASHKNKWLEYQERPEKKIGIVWSTALSDAFLKEHPMHAAAKVKKSIALRQLEPLFHLSHCCFFPLQIAISEEDHRYLSKYDNICDVSEKLSTFSDTAAMIDEMDLVISIDTSVAHLAGAMGKETINLLGYVSIGAGNKIERIRLGMHLCHCTSRHLKGTGSSRLTS